MTRLIRQGSEEMKLTLCAIARTKLFQRQWSNLCASNSSRSN